MSANNGGVVLLVLILAFCANRAFSSETRSNCRHKFKEFAGSCYGLSVMKVPWPEAQVVCRNLNANLVIIETEKENEFVKDLAKQADDSVWIGATAPFSHEDWMWVREGKPPLDINNKPFNDWGSGQPNNYDGVQYCMFLYVKDNFRWHDEYCSYKFYFMCEYSY